MKRFALPLLFLLLAGTAASAAPKPLPAPSPVPATTLDPALKPVDATGWTTPRPPYPESARKVKLAGSVRVRVNTDRHGKVTKATVIQTSGHKELDDATVQYALANWTGPRYSQAEYVQNYAYRR